MSDDVRLMYERFPYPSPDPGSDLIYDTAIALDFIVDDLDGGLVLDAGCGTGHRLVAMALQFPQTRFVGVDFSDQSLAVAADLVARNGCDNVELLAAEVGGADLGRRFDVVTSTGVIHHLPDPARGVAWLHDHLRPDGISYVWLYHAFGEFDRLLQRELARLLATGGPSEPQALLRDLGLSLSQRQYGSRTAESGESGDARLAADVDAFLHPVVYAYRFADALALFRDVSEWAVVNGVTWPGGAAMVDVTDWSGTARGTLARETLFPEPGPRELFGELAPRQQLTCVELCLKPTGFGIVAGAAAAVVRCADRVRANIDAST